MIVRDDTGREMTFHRAPQRIVSLVPSISETLWHLGVAERLAGVTRYCTDPLEVRALPKCGGTKNPDCEQIVALRPDLIFMSEEENRWEDFGWLVSHGFAVFVSFPRRVDEVADWVRRVGAAVASVPAAEDLAREIDAALGEVTARARNTVRPRIFCPIWRKPWMSFNADTYTHDVLRVCGGDNVFAGAADRYCKVTLEEAAHGEPDLLLLPDEPYPFAEKHLAEMRPLLRPRGPARAARVVDGQALSWYGTRTPRGLRIIQDAILGR